MLDTIDMINLGALITLRLKQKKIIFEHELTVTTGIIIDAIMEFFRNIEEESK